MAMQSLIRTIYPPQCVACGQPTDVENSLCGACWPDTRFINGTKCDKCGAPLPGEADGEIVHCDDCMRIVRPWDRGRAALVYSNVGRKLVLGLKHGDRLDYIPALSNWMLSAGADILDGNPILVPVPLHRWRILRRKYNQAAELAKSLGRMTGADLCCDAMIRKKQTPKLDWKSAEERFETVQDAFAINPERSKIIEGRAVVLIDDVMTSGATLAACAEVCKRAGAETVSVLVLARVAKDT